ncbi:TetR family transcriptional regulator [Prauserella shujinwangii]|uniref:TetR family transcriptional regulator n=2 Tax=Prauserella shujinwangii TaxID=1453103 RepID=A0A2T0LKN4_9PSEU|nr:TetR family transcriptional regulator [Prauserella shujinwangii]
MAPERRRRLLATAAREFAVEGYRQASLNRIIRLCGLSKSSFYYYVRSKEELFELVVDQLSAQLADELSETGPDDFRDDFWATAERLLRRLLAVAEREPLLTDLGRMFSLPGAPAGPESAVGRATAAAESWLDRVLAAGRAAGTVRADLPPGLQRHVTFAVLRALDEWTLRHQDLSDRRGTEPLLRAQLDLLHRLLAP